MRNITPTPPLTADQCRINTTARAVVMNLRVEGLIGLPGPNLELRAVDNSGISLSLHKDFAPFAAPGDILVCSLTLMKNVLEPDPAKLAALPKGMQ